MGVSLEFRCLVECCRLAYTGETNLVMAQPDWSRFIRLTRFHRVQGLVWKALASHDPETTRDTCRALSSDASEIAVANLRAAVESQHLLSTFNDAGLPLLFVKGLTLAMRAYGEISTKAGVDIDILVDRQHLQQASALLQGLGYRLVHPAVMDKLPIWHDLRKESTWLKADSLIQVDLHTRLADNPQLIPNIGLASPRQTVEVAPNIALPTLAQDELFAYLCVHGASSAWFRLKWVTDFAALIHGVAAGELERLYLRSQELGAGRAAAQALLLADSIYGSLGEATALKRRLQRDFQNRWLWRIAFRQLAGRLEPREPTSHFLGTAAIHYSQFLLLPGPAFKVSEFVRQGRAALD
jgi:hypothetical protein